MRIHSSATHSHRDRAGLTLAEVVVSTLLVGLVVVTSMKTVGGVIRTWQVIEEQHDGMALAVDLMTEVQQARYFEPDETEASGGGGGLLGGLLGTLLGGGSGGQVVFGPDNGESSSNRSDWDDTDDYDDWSASPPQARNGTVLSEYNGWIRSVVVQKVTVDDPNNVIADNSDDDGVRRITVTVTAPNGAQTVLVGLRSYCGALEQVPDVETTYVTWVDSKLQVGAASTALRTATNLTNGATSHQLLAAHQSPQGSSKNVDIDTQKWAAHYFKPTLPGAAASWSITRVQFRAKQENPGETMQLQIRPADGANQPSTAVLESVNFSSSLLGGSYAWHEVEFNSVTGLDPTKGYVFVVKQSGGNTAAKFEYDDGSTAANMQFYKSDDAGASWSAPTSNADALIKVFGTVTLP